MPTVSELKERARGFEQRGDLATALKVYRHILTHLEGTPALAAELPLYVKIGDLSAKVGASADAVEMYLQAGTHYAAVGSARSLIALALKVQRLDPSRGDVYGQFSHDLLTRGHDGAATEVLRAAAERSGLEQLRAALAWAAERPEEEARGVLVRLAEALAQGDDVAQREAEAITAPPEDEHPPDEAPPRDEAPPWDEAPPPEEALPPDEPLQVERITEAEVPEDAAPGTDDLQLESDRWREVAEQVPAEVPPAEPPEPPPAPEPLEVLPGIGAGPVPLDIEPLVGMPAAPPAAPPPPPPPVESREPEHVPHREPARPSPPFAGVLMKERRRRRGKGWFGATAGLVLVLAGAAGAIALDLVPFGRGSDQAESPVGETPGALPPDDELPTAVTALTPVPSAIGADTVPPVDTTAAASTAAGGDSGLAASGDTVRFPPVPVPVDVPAAVAPPVAPVDTAPKGPPTVRVPAGTTIRDLLIVVEGLEVESAVPLSGRRGYRVVQRLPDGEPLVLTAAPMAGSDTAGISDARITVAGDTTVGSVRFWSFLVTARARADADTLARMLRRLVRARPVR